MKKTVLISILSMASLSFGIQATEKLDLPEKFEVLCEAKNDTGSLALVMRNGSKFTYGTVFKDMPKSQWVYPHVHEFDINFDSTTSRRNPVMRGISSWGDAKDPYYVNINFREYKNKRYLVVESARLSKDGGYLKSGGNYELDNCTYSF